jgi:hypothetical protein
VFSCTTPCLCISLVVVSVYFGTLRVFVLFVQSRIMLPSDFTKRVQSKDFGQGTSPTFPFGLPTKRAIELSSNVDEFVNKWWRVGRSLASEAAHLYLDDLSDLVKGNNSTKKQDHGSPLTMLMDSLSSKWNPNNQLRVKISFMGETRMVSSWFYFHLYGKFHQNLTCPTFFPTV